MKSAREPSSTYSSSNRVGGTFNSAYSSVLDGNGSGSPAVELERARIKIRKLEKEVSIIMYSVHYVCSWYFWSDKIFGE